MKRVFILGCVFVSLIVAGCSQSNAVQVDNNKVKGLVDEFVAVNTDTAAKVAKAKDLDNFRKLMDGRETQLREIVKKIIALPKTEQEEIERHVPKLEESEKSLKAAIGKFHDNALAAAKHPQVVMETSMGSVKIELYESLAPITVKNFLRYTDEKFYDGTIFHRVIKDFMVQGGGFKPGMNEKQTHASIKNESYNFLSNRRGTLAMARTPDPNSASAQFFINVVDNPPLDKENSRDGFGYAVFGKVVDGMEVVDKIRAVPTTTRDGHGDVPEKDVLIKSVRRIDEK